MPQSPLAFNTLNTAGRLVPSIVDKQGSEIITAAHGNKYWGTYNLHVFAAANPTAVVTSAGLATTYTGICLSNPAASGVNLEVRKVSGSFVVAPTAATGVGLITGFLAAGVTVHTTPLTPFSGLIGNTATPAGLVDSACTLVGTPRWTQFMAQASTTTTFPAWNIDMDGGLVIIPGGYIAIGTTIASAAAGFQGAFEWAEWPV